MFDFFHILIGLPGIILAITLHEYAHAQVATWLGDPTAKLLGRLSFHPKDHIDPMGFLSLIFIGFGWAKPVPYQPEHFTHPRRDAILTAIAGPLTNFAIGLIGTFGLTYLSFQQEVIAMIWSGVVIYNIGFGVFNLLPIPPLDGSKLFLILLSPQQFSKIEQYQHIPTIIFMGAFILESFFHIPTISFILTPLIDSILVLFKNIT